MTLALGFAALAVIGTLTRAITVSRLNNANFPIGTLAVNAGGSFLLGLLNDASPETLTLLGLAALGSFTTFSTFAHESVLMVEERRLSRAGLYLSVTVIAGVGAATLGIRLSP